VATKLDEWLPSDIGLTIGTGHFSGFTLMRMNRPRSTVLVNGQFACIGQGLITAIGATIATGKPMVLVDGDASTLMHLQEIDTAARYHLPLLVVVFNDTALGVEYFKLISLDFKPDLAVIPSGDLGQVARGFGCRGHLVRSMSELQSAVEDFVANPGPMLIDVRVSRTVPSIPTRRTDYGLDV